MGRILWAVRVKRLAADRLLLLLELFESMLPPFGPETRFRIAFEADAALIEASIEEAMLSLLELPPLPPLTSDFFPDVRRDLRVVEAGSELIDIAELLLFCFDAW